MQDGSSFIYDINIVLTLSKTNGINFKIDIFFATSFVCFDIWQKCVNITQALYDGQEKSDVS